MSTLQFKKSLQILSKKHGLSLRADAAKYLKQLIEESDLGADGDAELASALSAIAVAYQQANSGACIVTLDELTHVVESLRDSFSRREDVNENSAANILKRTREMAAMLVVIDLFKVHKFDYSTVERAFIRSNEPLQLHASASIQANILRGRFDIIKQRILRNEHFRPPSFAAASNVDYYEITPIKNLSGCKPGSYLLLGMLTQMEEGKHHLEDVGSFIELEFNHGAVARTVGLFTHNCFVLIEGEYTDRKTFAVNMMGMPPNETRQQTLSTFGYNPNIFGVPRETNSVVALEKMEKEAAHISIVFMSDVWLDDPKVMAKLRLLFEGYSERAFIPLAFVLIGNFASKPYIYNGADYQEYKDLFKSLADLIHEFPAIYKTSRFIFVPGPGDPWAGNMIPRPPIPDVFLQRIRAKIPGAVVTSNPARIKYCSQEIVVFREDLMSKMRRNCIIPPDEEQEPELKEHLARTIIQQSHLSPMPLEVQPRLASFDHTLRLYPLPHLIVLADKYDSYQTEYEGTLCMNPGSFGNQGCFMTYSPSDGELESFWNRIHFGNNTYVSENLRCKSEMSAKASTANITIGLISWYCLIPNLEMDGSYITTPNISAGLFSYADIQIGGFDAWTYFVDVGIQAAVESINRDESLLPGIHINIKRFSDCGSWKPGLLDAWPISTGGFASTVMAHDIVDKHQDVIGVVGMETSSTTRGSASVLSIGQIPYCSGAAASPRLSNKIKFPYFWRTISHAGYLDILHTLQHHSISIQEQFSLSKTATAGIHDHLALALNKISARYIIILGDIDFTAEFINAMGERGLIDKFHVYIGDNVPWPSQNAKLLYGEKYFSYLKGFIQFSGFISERTKNYYRSMAEVSEKLGYNITELDIDYNNIFQFYDCVKTMAHGMNSLLQDGASPAMLAARQLNYEMDYKQFRNTGYSGNLGDPLTFDEKGDIRIYSGDEYKNVIFAELDAGGLEFTMYNESVPIFFDGGTIPPREGPPMLPHYVYAYGSLEGICLIVLIILGVATASFSAVVLCLFRTHRTIRSSPVPEMLTLSAGCIVIVVALLGYVGPSTAKSCSLRVLFIFFGFTLFATPLIAKTAKIWALAAADRRLKETEARRIAFVSRAANCFVAAIAMTIGLCWIAQVQMSVRSFDTPELGYARCVESSASASSYALYAFAVILLLGLCASSILSGTIKAAEYNESTMLGLVVYIFSFGAYLVKIISGSSNERTDFFMAVIIWTIIMTVFSMVVLTRLYALFSERQSTARFLMHASHAVKVMTTAEASSRKGATKPISVTPVVRDYNFKELCSQLESRLVTFRTRTPSKLCPSSWWGWSAWAQGRLSVHEIDKGRRKWIEFESVDSSHSVGVSETGWSVTRHASFVYFARTSRHFMQQNCAEIEFGTDEDAEVLLLEVVAFLGLTLPDPKNRDNK
ncbi:hypothetical protein CcCBS67573_g06713 [Chytriomyces confervae]|uniref:DNA polymerase epsilon subunit B n=1 Tax=Chytriomyces confervae TaxID=246404 RepID=A0A507F2R9_9FUNG|nr:DNA polymerase epsilon subunit 2 [Chytriomyces hyalinus]TPX69897.1 hypothetical protein CcCBS67573_g06713 [Chytriomyces confervae]